MKIVNLHPNILSERLIELLGDFLVKPELKFIFVGKNKIFIELSVKVKNYIQGTTPQPIRLVWDTNEQMQIESINFSDFDEYITHHLNKALEQLKE